MQAIDLLPAVDIHADIVAVGSGANVTLYDAHTGERLRQLSTGTYATAAAAQVTLPFLRFDGHRIIYASGSTVTVLTMPLREVKED